MISLTIYAAEGTSMKDDALVRRVSKDVEGQQAQVRRASRTDVPCTFIVISDSEAAVG